MAGVWREVLLLTIREVESKKNDGSGFGMWVIQKILNDKSFNVTIRAGRYYTDKVNGEKRYPKDGLSDWDFMALKNKSPDGQGLVWDKIKVLIDRKNPPAVTPLEEEKATKQSPAIEEAPW